MLQHTHVSNGNVKKRNYICINKQQTTESHAYIYLILPLLKRDCRFRTPFNEMILMTLNLK